MTLEVRPGSYAESGAYLVSTYELATGWVGGYGPSVLPPAPSRRPGARQAFEAAVLRLLQRSPTLVAFSGGRDSSAVLAVACHVARREGLPLPVAVTHDFTGQGPSDETAWQEMVIRHVGVQEWLRSTSTESFDVLGDSSRAGLRRHGLLYPAMLHCHAPLLDAGRDGVFVTGQGGDEMLGVQRMTGLNYLITSRARPSRGLVRMLARDLAPAVVRRRVHAAQLAPTSPHPWLSSSDARLFIQEQARDVGDAPLRWDRAVYRHTARRNVAVYRANLQQVLDPLGMSLGQPFLDEGFAAALAHEGGARGFITRTRMMRHLFSDLLPDAVLSRGTKATFGAAAIGAASREFIRTWDGSGLPQAVDPERFREACLADVPYFSAQLPLQAAWLSSQGLPVAVADGAAGHGAG